MRLIFTLLFIAFSAGLFGQLNVEILGQLSYNQGVNDIWGYTNDNGEEFALVGTRRGVSIVDITDSANPVEVTFIDQQPTGWRDIKTWGDFAYVTSEAPSDGVLVIDLSTLPATAEHYNIQPILPNGDVIGPCHNLYIDENGFAYLAGCIQIEDNGGVQIFDVHSSEGEIKYVSTVNDIYSHDVYARDNVLYSSEIDRGVFTMYDVSDKQNIFEISSTETPSTFTHNTWLSDNGRVVFTTDERPNAYVAAYDVSNPFNVREIDAFRPRATVGTGVVPHNVHVKDDYLVVSYYTDGLVIVDASVPDNLVEVGNFDTYLQDFIGFEGAWGAFPFFDSGKIIVSDIQRGLFVLAPTYVRAARLEGKVYDSNTMEPVNNAKIEILELELDAFSKANGEYKTGTHLEGSYQALVSRRGYKDQIVSFELVNGQVTLQDIFLIPQPEIRLTGIVTDAATGLPLEDAEISILYQGVTYRYSSDALGFFGDFTNFPGEIEVFVGKWGYNYEAQIIDLDENVLEPVLNIALEPGYEDIFELDLGWNTTFEGQRGEWIRVKPIGTMPLEQIFINPDSDTDDPGIRAYVTGHADDFDASLLMGTAILESPPMDLSALENPAIQFDYWLWATTIDLVLNEIPITFSLSNGIDSVVVAEVRKEELITSEWTTIKEIIVSDFIELTPEVRFSATISSTDEFNWTEAGIDRFRVIEGRVSAANEIEREANKLNIYPNPSSGQVVIQWSDRRPIKQQTTLDIMDVNGRIMYAETIEAGASQINIQPELNSGVYFCRLSSEKEKSRLAKLIIL